MLRLILTLSALLAIGICGRFGVDFGSGRGQGGVVPPSFLRNVSMEARRQYFQIVSNRTITIASQQQALQTWGTANGVAAQVTQYHANVTQFNTQLNQNVTQLISQLAQGQQQFNQILTNQNQTLEQQQQAMMNLRNQSSTVFDTVKYMNQLFRKRQPRGPKGGFNGFNGGLSDFGGRGNEFSGRDGMGHGGQGFNSFDQGEERNHGF